MTDETQITDGKTIIMQALHFLYHEILSAPSGYTYAITSAEFERHCEMFERLRRDDGSSLRPEVTFDDGHLSDHEFALPILRHHGLQARFFITAGWTGCRAGFMDWEQLRALDAAGQQIGAHGMTHKLLTHCSARELDEELRGARLRLEDGLGTPVTTMSLPGGRWDPAVLRACWDAGYTEVFTSSPRAESMVRPAQGVVGRLNVRSSNTADWLGQVLHQETGVLASLERQERIKAIAKRLLGDRLYAGLWSVLNRQGQASDAETERPTPEIPVR